MTVIVLAVGLSVLSAGPARALVKFDFEQKYLVHPEIQTWDFCIVRDQGLYHAYYTAIPDEVAHSSGADSLYHATSPDLKRWTLEGPVLAVGADNYNAGALWAPDVVWDDATQLWHMAYTSADEIHVQRISFATSPDLYNWTEDWENPIVEPEPGMGYVWAPDRSWSDFRDPYIYRENDQWHMLVTAKQTIDRNRGVIWHGVSDDLRDWIDVGPMFVNDADTLWYHVLESPQYHTIGSWHHLMFGLYDDDGITYVSTQDKSSWSMIDGVRIDYGFAPEVDEFDPGHRIFSRLTPFYKPSGVDLAYVIRMDTLQVDPDGGNLTIHKPNPFVDEWDVYTGVANLGNPIFGDNPLWRHEPTTGLVGHGYYSSREYYQGPQSGRGAPGVELGDGVTGTLISKPFVIEGNRMDLLVGGGDYPATCYVALVDMADTTVIHSETGLGHSTMTPRQWDLSLHQGKTCTIQIIDAESGPDGYVMVDEITEWVDISAVLPSAGTSNLLADHRAAPNPFNPRTTISFTLTRDADVRLRIHDVRGRAVWESGTIAGREGHNLRVWNGTTSAGRAVPAGTYLYSVEAAGLRLGTGKLSLVK